ncbi:AraC family transcriptional regulator [Massilia sp. SM-13]|uniref:AraC family transcriptional regulator n=1 Tax=Pseudoduganella rhizocola TaxID=3382643 RepID=UPI0038B64EF5
MSPDLLSGVLRKLRLRGAVCSDMECGGDFATEAPAPAGAVLQADHVMGFHAVLRGRCWCSTPGGEWVLLEAGDFIIFPHGHACMLASSEGATHARRANAGDTPATVRVLSGVLGCDAQPFNPLLATLPEMLSVRGAESGNWIACLLVQAIDALRARQPGAPAMLERMTELMFLDALCRHTALQGEERHGWLAGLQDRQIGRVLALIHEDPGHGWTGEELGARVGLSRSVLYERFAALIGQTPAQYLINWRMQVAAGRLRSSSATVAAIACEVGYESEASFSRAFRRIVGAPPAAWRRAHARAATSGGSGAGSSG